MCCLHHHDRSLLWSSINGGLNIAQPIFGEVRRPNVGCFDMFLIFGDIGIQLDLRNIDVLFPLVGWLIEGVEETPLTLVNDDRCIPNLPLYFYQKEIIVEKHIVNQ